MTNEERENPNEAPKAAGHADAGLQTHVRPSGSVGGIWTAWRRDADAIRIFGNYRNTFKPAAIDFGIGEPEGAEGPLKPETSQSVEGGLKTRAWQGRTAFDATVFRMNFANLVVPTVVNGLPAIINAGTQNFSGIEFDAVVYATRAVTARASYSFHDATFTDFVQAFDGVSTELAGKRLEMSARHLASAGLVFAPARGPLLAGELNVVGSRFLDRRNTALADAYATIAVSAGYRTPTWELRVTGRNLTDERPPVSESELGDAQYCRLPGRRVDLAVSYRFTR